MGKLAQWVTSVGAAITFIGGSLIAAHAHFETSANAQVAHDGIRQDFVQYQTDNAEQTALFRIQLIENQISQYRYQLLSGELSPEQREWIIAEIRKLESEISCIRAGQC
jgi:hypothetical protein